MTYPRRKKRSESFLGIHFDFHAGDDCDHIGANTTREMIEAITDKVQPDYVQCDCKGHPGYASYPTKVGYPAPGIVTDALRIWRDVTAERGVSLYMHYSGVIDGQACEHHPEWCRIDEKGERDPRVTSVFSLYVDELLIPQLIELSDGYGVDGVWVDGECWGTMQDYSEAALAAFRESANADVGRIVEVPRAPEDPFFREFTEFGRDAFRRYLRHYVDALHAHNPDFEIASNWAYSSQMPEPVEIDVDFISGDYTLQDSVNSARLEGRCMMHQGQPWDLMAWAFARKFGEPFGKQRETANSTKSAVQLMREAAIVLALGGGFQAYFPQKRDGSVRLWEMDVMAQVAEFCRARQAICHRAEPVPQIGLLYSRDAYYRQSTRLFAPWRGELEPLRGTLQALLEGQNVVDIVMEHHLEDGIDYPLIVVPEWSYLDPAFRDNLLAYVDGGGSLLVVGPRAVALFDDVVGVVLEGEPEEKSGQWLALGGHLAGLSNTVSQPVRMAGARPLGRLYLDNDPIGASEVAASIADYGQGKIGAVHVDLGECYLHGASFVVRDFLTALVRELMPVPMVTVTGSHYVDVTLTRQDGALVVNLINTAGPHANRDIYAFDEIPPIGPLDIAIRVEIKPGRVWLAPEGADLAHTYDEGVVHLTLDRLVIHSAIVVE